MNHMRHGDVPLHKTDKVEGTKKKHNGSVILAWGETTGHNHQLTVERPQDMQVYQINENEWTIILSSEGTLTHPEHKTLKIAPGTWRVGREREVDHFSQTTRKVID